jgi:hypothetical protein
MACRRKSHKIVCSRSPREIGLRKGMARLATVLHQEPPLEHDVFRDRQNTLLEHRPDLVREPVIEFGSLGRIGQDLDPEPYFGERYRTDVKQFERLGGNECDHLAIGLWAAELR